MYTVLVAASHAFGIYNNEAFLYSGPEAFCNSFLARLPLDNRYQREGYLWQEAFVRREWEDAGDFSSERYYSQTQKDTLAC